MRSDFVWCLLSVPRSSPDPDASAIPKRGLQLQASVSWSIFSPFRDIDSFLRFSRFSEQILYIIGMSGSDSVNI